MPRETDINTALAEEKAAQKRLDALREKAVEIHGENIAVAELGGRVWCLLRPAEGFRVLWQRYKASKASPDPTTAADADVQLARAMLVPVDSPATKEKRDAERKLFDELGDVSPALLDALAGAAEGLALGPLPLRAAKPGSSSSPDGATPTSPPTP